MFLLPVLQPLRISEKVKTAMAVLRQALARPETIDYKPSSVTDLNATRGPTARQPTGRLAHLPSATCPICHLRLATNPIPLGAGGSASSISLPPVTAPGADDDETKVFVPARADCWAQCVYCYYCITGALLEGKDSTGGVVPNGDVKRAWECLRCGGEVHSASRVIPEITTEVRGDKVDATEPS